MKKTLFTLILALLVSPAYALFETSGTSPERLPTFGGTAFYFGAHDKTFGDLGLNVRLEFAVYNGAQADIVKEDTGYTGDAEYVYAYQVFCNEPSITSISTFELIGVDGSSVIASNEVDIHEQAALDSGAIPSDGIQPKGDGGYFNDSKAIWEFDDGTFIQGQQSWFLFLYSNNGPAEGTFNVTAPSLDDDAVPMPDNDIPEPATLALLAGGALLSLRRRR